MAVTDAATEFAARPRRGVPLLGRSRLWLLVVPMLLFFVLFFVLPVLSMFALSLDKPAAGTVAAEGRLRPHQFHSLLHYAALL